MKRMGALLGLTSLVTLSFAYYLGEIFTFSLLICSILLLVLGFAVKKLRKYKWLKILLGTVVVSCLFFNMFTQLFYNPVVYNNAGKEIEIRGKIVDPVSTYYEKYYYYIECDKFNGESSDNKVLIKSEVDLGIGVDDTVDLETKVYSQTNDTYISKGYYIYGYIDDKTSVKTEGATSHSYKYYPYLFRETLRDNIYKYMNDDNAGICCAVALGERSGVTGEVKENFRKAGISHLLVVSGLHMSIISFMLLLIFKIIFRKRKIYSFATILFILFYMVMTGLTPSVVRSGIMMIIILVGYMISRDADSLNSLGISAMVILIFNPYSVGDIGMLLSYSSTLGIILFAKPIKKYLDEKLKFRNRIILLVLDIIIISVSAIVLSTPLLIIFFHNVSLVQIFANLFTSLIFQVLLITTMVGALLSLTGIISLYAPFLYIANFLTTLIKDIAYGFSEIPFSYIKADETFVYLWLVANGVFVAVIILTKNYKRNITMAVMCSAVILLVGIVSNYAVNYDKAFLTVYDSGEGLTATMSHQNQNVVLSCGGDYSHYDTADKLEEDNITCDMLAVTTKYKKRTRYFSEVAGEFDLNNIFIYDGVDKDLYEKTVDPLKVKGFSSNQNIFYRDVKIELIVANKSVFTYITAKDKTVLIMPTQGDCSYLEERYRTADIVVTDSACENDYLINCNLLVLACSEESFGTLWDKVNINSNRLYTTYNGDFKTDIEVW